MKNIGSVLTFCFLFTFLHGTIVIDEPGTYNIPTDFIYTPTSSHDIALLINASNVKIDFQDHVLSITSDNTFPSVDGIMINNNVADVFIKNATIQDFTGEGIHILDGCANINIINNKIQRCHASGIFVDGSASGTGVLGPLVEYCLITGCTGAGGNAAYGIRMHNSSLDRISHSNIALCDAGITSSGYGIYLEQTHSIQIDHTTIIDCGGTNLVAGVALVESFTGLINEVTLHKNENRITGTVTGVFLDKSQDIIVSHCTSSVNTSGAASAIGFTSQNGHRNIFKDCLAELNTGGPFAAGIQFISEQNSRIFNCLIQDQKTLISGTAHGIVLSNNCDKCWTMENRLTNNLGADSSFGIIDERSASTSVVIRNYAFNNGTNYSVTYPLTISLPIISASLSNDLVGIPTNIAGVLDNISINP